MLLILIAFFLFGLLELVSFNDLYFFGEYDNDGSGSRSPGKSVGSAGDVGFGGFAPTGIESLGKVVTLVMFIPRGVDSKVGQLIGSFQCPKS